MVAGAAVPTLTASYSGFVNGDTVASLTAPAVLSTTATSGSAAGTYPITVGSAVDANYTITFVPGILTVTAVAGTGTGTGTGTGAGTTAGAAPNPSGGGGCGLGSGGMGLIGLMLLSLRGRIGGRRRARAR